MGTARGWLSKVWLETSVAILLFLFLQRNQMSLSGLMTTGLFLQLWIREALVMCLLYEH